MVALPVAFLTVFAFAMATGALGVSQLTDLFLATGSSRYGPVMLSTAVWPET